jgi:hypothetical protein
MGLEQDFSPFRLAPSSSIFASVVLIWVASLGEETEADHGGGEVKETSTIAKIHLERKKFQSYMLPYLVRVNSWLRLANL